MTLTLEKLHGQVLDVDSHEMMPTPRFVQTFGERASRLMDEFADYWADHDRRRGDDPNNLTRDRDDVMEASHQVVWEQKGPPAPAAIDMTRRTEVMDAMGIQRQLIFPGFGLFAFSLSQGGGYALMPRSTPDQMKIADGAVDAYNEWAGHWTTLHPSRLRIVGLLASGVPGLTPEDLVKKAEALIAMGVKAIMICSGLPLAGLSPANPLLDPFYALLAESDVSMVVHPPGGTGFRHGEVWTQGGEAGRPLNLAAQNAEDNFIATMVMGGVFDRHPTLRFGSIETSGHWIGPLADRLDAAMETTRRTWHAAGLARYNLPMKPSEYIARNVRVSVLLHEPVEDWFVRYPHLQDVYCYSSDYPHGEGGPHSLENFYERLSPLGDDIVKKFFITNSQLLLP